MRRSLRSAVIAGDLDSWAPHAAAFFFACGSGIAVFVALVPGRDYPLVSTGISVAGLLTTALLLLWSDRLGRRALGALLAVGTVCVSLGVLTASRSMGPDALLYVWVGLHAGFFLGRTALVLQVALVGVCYLVVLLLSPREAVPYALLPQALVLVTGTVATGGAWSLGMRRLAEVLLERQTRLAGTDALSGLVNRGELLRCGRELVEDAAGGAVVVVDLDRFKDVNDTLGHAGGDAVLRDAARRLTEVAPPGATAARLGGDEFAMLLTDADPDRADRTGALAHAALVAPFRVADSEVRIGASVGVALLRDVHRTFDAALRDADLAMYAAKRDGGGSRTYSPAMGEAERRDREMGSDLSRAIGAELTARYQPIVSTRSGRTAMVEALVRWEHPERGLMPPAEFIPLAERTGLVVPLGRWILGEACRTAAGWPADIAISVNLSPRQLVDDELVDDVRAALAGAGLPAGRLVLEVTETTIMAEPAQAAARLAELRDLGVRIAIDDFGTGHSSLATLQRLPVTDLKLAREFVAPLEDPAHDAALARAIVALGHALGLRLVGEGVELERQLDLLRELGCDLAQGFLLARPMRAEELARWLQRPAARGGVRVQRATTRTSAG